MAVRGINIRNKMLPFIKFKPSLFNSKLSKLKEEKQKAIDDATEKSLLGQSEGGAGIGSPY